MLLLPRPPPPLIPATLNPAADAGAGESFRSRLNFLSSLGFPDPHSTLTLHPSLRTHPLPSLRASFALLLTHGLLPSHAAAVLAAHPPLLAAPPAAALRFLSPLLPSPGSLSRAAARCPRLLASSVDSQLKPTFHFLRRTVGVAGFSPASASLLVLDVDSTLVPKIRFLESLPLRSNAVAEMIRRCPMILSYSLEQNLRPKVEFLVGEMGRDVRELTEFPQFFAFNLEGRIRPRLHLMREARLELSLSEMLKTSDERFRELLLEYQLRRSGFR